MPMPNPPVTNGPDMSIFAYLCNNPSVMKTSFRIYNVLRPLGWLYGLVSYIRNRFYDKGIIKSTAFPVPVIGIGNITVGGTGKTPHTEYLAALIKERFRTAVLSRGYGRCTKGYILADGSSTSRIIGDEPLQIRNRFPDIDVAVCEDRVHGINSLLESRRPQVIILDDAYQHRKVIPSLNILLVNYNRFLLDDAMLPAGRLREGAGNRRRAHMIIVTKCPGDLTQDAMDEITSRLAVSAKQQVFFTTLEYGDIYPLDGKTTVPAADCPVLAVTGIADPAPLEAQLRKSHSEVQMLSFPDHHAFSKRDISKIENRLASMPDGTAIITTAKDAARLQDAQISEDLKEKIFILPVKPSFINGSEAFDSAILNHIESFHK